jgi:hypothetical protein
MSVPIPNKNHSQDYLSQVLHSLNWNLKCLLIYILVFIYRAYTKEWCGIKSESLLKPHHSFVYALYYLYEKRVPGIFPGGGVRRADKITNFMCRLSRNLGASTPLNPKGLSRPVMGLLLRRKYISDASKFGVEINGDKTR